MADSTTVTVPDIRDIRRLWPEVGRRIETGMINAARSAGWWAASKAASSTATLGAVASHTFQRSWLSMPVRDGAIVSNKAEHAYFVEVGRKPGRRPPPVSAIMEWLRHKGVRPTGTVRPPRIVGEVSSAKQRARMRKAIKVRAKADRERPLRRLAWVIARKIGRKGTTGRFILQRLLPRISARWQSETRRQLDRLTRDPPR